MPLPAGPDELLHALRASDGLLRQVVEHAQDLIYYCDRQGRFTYVNPAAARVMKYTEADLLGRHFLTLIREDARPAAAEHYQRQLRDQVPTTYFEFPAVASDGEIIWVGQHVQLTFENGTVTGVHAIARDITRQRALEEQLRQAQKMEAVGRLARGVAHDFNNLLTAIMGYAELILRQVPEGSPIGLDAGEIGKSAERGARLTRELLAFSRSLALEPQVIDPAAAVRGAENMLRQLAGDDVVLKIEAEGTPASVRLAEGQLDQILVNLLVNARDATPAGGAIGVRIDECDVAEHDSARYPGLPAGRYARIAVRDTGAGIAPDAAPHVFEPFFTTKAPSKGTGLGLSIVYGIARDAGGTVTFSTAPGTGTTFEVLLPLVTEGL